MSNFQKFFLILWLFLFYYILLFSRHDFPKPPLRIFLSILSYSLLMCSFQRHMFCLSLFCDTVCVLSHVLWTFLIKEQVGFFIYGYYWFLLLYPTVSPIRQLAGREFCMWRYWPCLKAGFTLGWAKVGGPSNIKKARASLEAYALPSSAPSISQAIPLIFWEKKSPVFNLGKMRSWSIAQGRAAGRGQQCKCGLSFNYSFYLLHSLRLHSTVHLLSPYLSRPMEVCRIQGVVHFQKPPVIKGFSMFLLRNYWTHLFLFLLFLKFL